MASRSSPESSDCDWASLPEHLLDSIVDKLVHLPDLVRFSAVCKTWLYVAIDNNKHKQKQKQKQRCFKQKQIPMLMVPSAAKDNSDGEKRSLYSITDNKLYDFQLCLSYKKRCCGSSHGWLATVEANYAITLVNPFSGVAPITLPVLIQVTDDDYDYTNYEYDVFKVILSADPSLAPDSYEAAAIYGEFRSLAVIKSGDEAWTYIGNGHTLVADVTYYQGQVYALTLWRGVISLGYPRIGGTPELKIVTPKTEKQTRRPYLVESSAGELLQVRRFFEVKDSSSQPFTSGFEVYKLKQHPSGDAVWVETKSIGGDALFLGDGHSFSVVASQFPRCQPNSIYYTDDFSAVTIYEPFGPRDMGIFNLEDKRIRSHYTPDPSHTNMPPPIWIVPTLLGRLGLNQVK